MIYIIDNGALYSDNCFSFLNTDRPIGFISALARTCLGHDACSVIGIASEIRWLGKSPTTMTVEEFIHDAEEMGRLLYWDDINEALAKMPEFADEVKQLIVSMSRSGGPIE